jgi:hypothetical protein
LRHNILRPKNKSALASCLDVSDWWGLGHIHTWNLQTANKLFSRQKRITMTWVKQTDCGDWQLDTGASRLKS